MTPTLLNTDPAKRVMGVVASAALMAALSMGASQAATLVNNVKGYTLNESGKLITFSNLVIDEGKVVALNVEKDNHRIDETINGNGKVMLPGLIDAHGHLLGLGANLLEVNLRESSSAQESTC